MNLASRIREMEDLLESHSDDGLCLCWPVRCSVVWPDSDRVNPDKCPNCARPFRITITVQYDDPPDLTGELTPLESKD